MEERCRRVSMANFSTLGVFDGSSLPIILSVWGPAPLLILAGRQVCGDSQRFGGACLGSVRSNRFGGEKHFQDVIRH